MRNKNTVNIELIDEKIKNIKDDIKRLETDVEDFKKVIPNTYATISTTTGLDLRVKRFESFWEWALKIILGAILMGILTILGMGATR